MIHLSGRRRCRRGSGVLFLGARLRRLAARLAALVLPGILGLVRRHPLLLGFSLGAHDGTDRRWRSASAPPAADRTQGKRPARLSLSLSLSRPRHVAVSRRSRSWPLATRRGPRGLHAYRASAKYNFCFFCRCDARSSMEPITVATWRSMPSQAVLAATSRLVATRCADGGRLHQRDQSGRICSGTASRKCLCRPRACGNSSIDGQLPLLRILSV